MRMKLKIVPILVTASALVWSLPAAHAETVMQQCGQQYQAAKAAGTLNGMSWNQFRSDCAAKLKAQPASAAAPATQAPSTPPAAQVANPLNPTPAAAVPTTSPATAAAPATSPAAKSSSTTGGRAAFVARERECGSEWRANKVSLTAQTPGLTWPKYLSQCNARLKAAGK